MKIYLAANWHAHPKMREVKGVLTQQGHEVTSRWINGHGGEARREYALEDIEDLNAADAILYFAQDYDLTYSRGGKHVEFGYALAKGKKALVVRDGKEKMNLFVELPEVRVFETLEEAVEYINGN